MFIKKTAIKFFILTLLLGVVVSANAIDRTVNLTVAYKTVHFAGKSARAIAINNQIPGPTLHFKEGDRVHINVYNHIDRGTSIHWHGIILPWKMDGVEGVTQKAIPPGGVFHYQYTLHQHGTYWYHAHSELQEQEGMYGAFIIDPPRQTLLYTKSFPIVLSDWNNANPKRVYDNLKKEGDFYSINFPMQASIVQYFRDYKAAKTPAEKEKIFNAYKMMQTMRMSIYDISDVSYDAYLLNGHPKTSPWIAKVRVGDLVRLRFVGAGASTIFNVKIPGARMQMVQADGNNVKPYFIKSFSIAPGETFDVLVKITKNRPYVIYAESIDSLGGVIGVLKTHPNQLVHYKNIKPFPKPKPVMMMNHDMSKMAGMKMNHAMPVKNSSHKTSSSMNKTMGHPAGHQMMGMSHAMQGKKMSPSMKMRPTKMPMKPLSSKTKYDRLKALVRTNNPNTSVHIIKMNLSGFMDRYIWFLNGVPEYKAKPIMIKHGHWYRLVFTNNTMMHHPMHLHGHWMILRNGHGAYDPKVHTIDVPPGATVVADFHADTSGQWYFHCHNLMHMKAGMANIFRYTGNSKKDFIGLSGHKTVGWFLANEFDLRADFFHDNYEGTLHTLFGKDYNKLEINAEDAEFEKGVLKKANVDVFYWRLIDQFWAIKGGVNYVYRPAASPYWQPGVGLEGLMPYFIQTDVRAYLHDGSLKFDLELARNTQITHRLFLRLSIESILATKTVSKDEIGNGLNSLEYVVQPYYQLNPNMALYLQYQRTDYFNALKRIRISDAESSVENTYSVGVALLF